MSRDYNSIIEFENENSGIDFKAIQYEKNRYAELLKDIIAMANADIEGERLIVTGVKHKPDGNKEILPIKNDKFIDSATYQQVVQENIEPDLKIEYDPHLFNGNLVGLLKIRDCYDQPYILKKDFGKLKKGDCFIRKGTHQLKASRADLDRIYTKKDKKYNFDDSIDISFSGTNYMKEITLSPIRNMELPSQRAEKKIRSIIKKKTEEKGKITPHADLLSEQLKLAALRPLLGPTPYENRSIDTLEQNLSEVEETYQEDDRYEFFEIHSFRLNFDILNSADEYIQDASVLIELVNNDSFIISDKILEKPDNGFLPKLPPINSIILNYPQVNHVGEIIQIISEVGEVKHHLKSKLLSEDIRLAVLKKPNTGNILLTIKLYAKNIGIPIQRKLKIIISE